MQRCGSSHGPFHTQPNSFSMLLSLPFDHEPSSTAVDCTLSLGTPSTRVSRDHVWSSSRATRGCDDKPIFYKNNIIAGSDAEKQTQNRGCVTNFGWDLLHMPFQPSPFMQNSYKAGRESFNGEGGDPLLARRCANCDTTSTPLWRNGPRGPKSLCNACGIRFKKEERRAAGTAGGAPVAEPQRSWVPLPQSQKVPCFSPAIGDDSTTPFLSWRINVTDRPSLVHDFTR